MTVNDDIFYININRSNCSLKFFQTSPYLNNSNNCKFARLVYISTPPFGKNSIKRKSNNQNWYKTIHKIKNGRKVSVSNKEIFDLASRYNFDFGHGIHRELTRIPLNEIDSLHDSEQAIEFLNDNHIKLLNDISNFYNSKLTELRLTGSAIALRIPYKYLNDLDLIIPVKNMEHLNYLNRFSKNPQKVSRVKLGHGLSRNLKRKYSALRWIHENGQIVCPFFVYSGLYPPVLELQPTGYNVSGKIKIIDDKFGIFNTQCFRCSGAIEQIMICTTVARGEINVGMEFNINCPIYNVTKGFWAGKDVAVVNDPYLDFANLELSGK